MASEKSEIKNHSTFSELSEFNNLKRIDIDIVQLENCTITLKASVFLGFFSIEVSCSGTGSTCQIATQKATSCLNTAINTVKKSVT
jgi:hypothetical protein